MKERKLHYHFAKRYPSICGKRAGKVELTSKIKDVTCDNCLRVIFTKTKKLKDRYPE